MHFQWKGERASLVFTSVGFGWGGGLHHQAARHMLLLSAEAGEDVQSVGVKPQAQVSSVLLDRSSGTSPSFASQLVYSVIDFKVLICVVFVSLNLVSVVQEHHSDVNDEDSEDEHDHDVESDVDRPAQKHLTHHSRRSVTGRLL